MLSVDNLGVSFAGETLFSGISFLINPKERVALVGKNGAGKTTLMKILCAQMNPSEGKVSKSGECTLGYLPQQMRVADTTTLLDETSKAFSELIALEEQITALGEQISLREDYESEDYHKLIQRLNDATDRYHILGGDNREAEIEKILLGLGFKRDDFSRPTREFSGGWRMRIELAKLLLSRPSVFLLDEPTNHLDIESIEWLESYLKDYQGAVILISHDRAFLDNVTTRTIEINSGKAYDYKASYTKFIELRGQRREAQKATQANQQKMIDKTEEFIERFRYKATKSNQVQARIKALDKIDRVEIDDDDISAMNIKFPPAPRSGQIVCEIKAASKSFGDKLIFEDAEFHIEKGEKIAFVGRNGEGKTTLARIITGELDYTSGLVKLGHGVKIGYYAQNQEDLMDGDATVFDTLDRVAVGDIRTKLRDILGAFLFRGEDIDKKVKVLSGGERARLAMARLMLEPYNLLILDEPTNHMDMRSKEILKQALQAFDGTVILVSHDREFLDGLAQKVYEFRNTKVKAYLGGIYYFLQKRKLENISQIEKKEAEQKTAVTPSKGKEDYLERKEAERAIRKAKTAVEQAEKEIENLEAQIAQWDEKLASGQGLDLSDANTYAEYNELKNRLDKQMTQWERLEFELEMLVLQ